jgi:ankyrin repeat protein
MKKNRFLLAICLLTLVNISLLAQTDKDYKSFSRFIRQNKTDKILGLIKNGKNINSKDKMGVTPLLYSLQLNKSNIAKLLINGGADINLYDNSNNGSLHYAIEKCTNTDIIYELIDKVADINHPNSKMYTPFHFALLYKCPEIPLYLIKKGADYKLKTSSGENALHLSVNSGCDTIVSFLLDKGLDYNLADNDGNTPLLVAIKTNRRAITEKLLNLGANVLVENAAHYTPIFYSIKNTDTLIFNRLINMGAKIDIEAEGVPPIYLAASIENKFFVEKLLINGAQNPMKCDIHDLCYQTAFIYSVSASIANQGEKLGLYSNSLNIYNLAREKYLNELNKIRRRSLSYFWRCCNRDLLRRRWFRLRSGEKKLSEKQNG